MRGTVRLKSLCLCVSVVFDGRFATELSEYPRASAV